MTKADEILKKYEDLNEYHFYEVDRNWIIAAMEEYKSIPIEPPVKPEIAGIVRQSKISENEYWIDFFTRTCEPIEADIKSQKHIDRIKELEKIKQQFSV